MRLYAHSLALLALSACSQRLAPQQPAASKPRTVSTIPINTAPGDTALVLERTPCYGTCPSYKATVFRSGKVSYDGGRFVLVTGQHTLTLDQSIVTAMLNGARSINFNSMKPEYLSGASDMPAIIVIAYLPGQKRHRVLAERGAAPQPLQAYFDSLTRELDQLAGINAER